MAFIKKTYYSFFYAFSHKSGQQFIFGFLILALWFALHYSVILWIIESFSESANRFSFLVALLLAVILIYKNRKKRIVLQLQFQTLPVILFVISIVAFLLAEYFIDIHILSAFIFGIGGYALLGFYLPKHTWRQNLLLAILFIQTLPFGNHIETYIGFPMRMFTAEIVEAFLEHLNISYLSQETIIMVENRASQIDLACSGLKGIWSGTLFFIAITWIEQRRTNFVWITMFVFFISTLFIFNVFRILILVFVDTVYKAPEFAGSVHLPLGIMGFVFSCIIGWELIRLVKSNKKSETKILSENNKTEKKGLKNYWAQIILICFLIVAMAFHSKKQYHPSTSLKPTINLPSDVFTQKLQLTDAEKELLVNKSNGYAEKFSFQWNGYSGTILFSMNSQWRSHHDPILCMRGNGLLPENIQTLLIKKNFPIKTITFSNCQQSACYWFYSENKITDDFSTRVWADILNKQEQWMLVSVMFHEKIQWDTPEMISFQKKIYKAVSRLDTINKNI